MSGSDDPVADQEAGGVSGTDGFAPQARVAVPRRAWMKILGAFALATLAVVAVPRLGDPSGQGPAIATLLGTAGVVAALTCAAMFVVVRHQLRMRTAAAIYAVGFTLLLVAVKFVLSPFGLYEVNRHRELEQVVSPLGDGWGTVLTAGLVGGLYVAVYWLIYRMARRRLADPTRSGGRQKARTALLVVLILMIIAAVLLGSAAIIVVLLVGDAVQYLVFITASSVSVLVGIALAIATALVALLFREATDQQEAVGKASLVVSVFWLGLAFLALYHVLWVVYILVLTTLWPLRVVTPK